MSSAKLTDVKWRYAATGSLAAQVALADRSGPPSDALRRRRRQRGASALDVRETDTGANVIIAEPFDDVVFDRTATADGMTLAAPSQVVADLPHRLGSHAVRSARSCSTG